MKKIVTLNLAFFSLFSSSWEIQSFERGSDDAILQPKADSVFLCPILQEEVSWEKKHTFNPTAVLKDGKVHLIYRAEDGYGRGIGKHISRLGLAVSDDGIHFERQEVPIFYPDLDEEKDHEFPGGCEDPRIVQSEEGTYIMTYTQWNRKIAALAVATSKDLLSWEKKGYAFKGYQDDKKVWSKSGSIICRLENDQFIATKINGKYWMYWGDGSIYMATSDDLIAWTPVVDERGELIRALNPRAQKFDSDIVEPGPQAIIRDEGILLLYNGKNALGELGDRSLSGRAYASGQALFSLDDPTKLLTQLDAPFLKPEAPFEKRGQYRAGAIFIQGLVSFQGNWVLYYGASDAKVGVAVAPK